MALPFIVDTEDNGDGYDLTVNAANQAANVQAGNITSSSLEIIIGSAFRDIGKAGEIGAITLTGEETVTISSVGTATDGNGGNTINGDISLTPGAAYLHEYLTISGTQNLYINGGIQDYNPLGAPGNLNINDLVLSVTDTGVVTVIGEINALQILAATSGGFIMWSADNNFSNFSVTGTNAGDLIIGSATGANVLIGSIGNDTITGTLSTSAQDTIATGGGADQIALAQNHTASDHIELYTGSGLLTMDGGTAQILSATPDSIVNSDDYAQPGWWGVNTNGTNQFTDSDHTRIGHIVDDTNSGALPPGDYTYGTGSYDMSTVTNFSTAHDVVDISVSAFANLLENFYAEGNGGVVSDIAVAPSSPTTAFFTQAIFSRTVIPGQDVQYNAAAPDSTTHANVLVLSGVYANDAQVAQTLGSPVGDTGITFSGGLTLNYTGVHFNPETFSLEDTWAGHIIIAYQNQSGSTVIADLDITANEATVQDTYSGNPNYAGVHETIAVSDLVQLTGITLNNLHTANIHFVA